MSAVAAAGSQIPVFVSAKRALAWTPFDHVVSLDILNVGKKALYNARTGNTKL
jgi:hypothetical protein